MKTIHRRTSAAAIRGMLALASAFVATGCPDGVDKTPQSQNLTGGLPGDSTQPDDPTQPDFTQFDVAEQDAAGGFTTFVEMGDSFSAGTGLSSDTAGCFTNDGAWPQLVAGKVNGAAAAPAIVVRACSGARMADITGPVTANQQNRGVTAPQIDALTLGPLPASTLITLTISGNDAGVDSFGDCLKAVSDPTIASADSQKMCTDIASAIVGHITGDVATNLATTFTALKNAAPDGAAIVAVGYPHTMPVTVSALCTAFGLDAKVPMPVRTLFNDGIDKLNKVIANAASAAGINSITSEIVTAFQGHELCTDEEWLVGITDPLFGVGEAMGHPNAAGNAAYASAVLAGLVSRGVMAAPSTTDASAPVAGSAAPIPGSSSLPGASSGAAPVGTAARTVGAAGAAALPRAGVGASPTLPSAGIGGTATPPRIGIPSTPSTASTAPKTGATGAAGSRASTTGVMGGAAGSAAPGSMGAAGSGAMLEGEGGAGGSFGQAGEGGDLEQAGEGGAGAEGLGTAGQGSEEPCTPGSADPSCPVGTEQVDAGVPVEVDAGYPSGTEPPGDPGIPDPGIPDPGTPDPGTPDPGIPDVPWCIPDEDGVCT